MTDTTEQQLLERSRNGDRDAFASLIECHAQRLLVAVRAELGDRLRQRLESGDVMQQVYVDALERIDRFEDRGRGSFFAWLKQIAKNRICDVDRRSFRTAKRNREVRAADISESVCSLLDAVVGSTSSPSCQADQAELFGRLAEAVSTLIPSQREAIELRYIEQLSVAETAARMERTERSVRQLCVRALIGLRQVMSGIL